MPKLTGGAEVSTVSRSRYNRSVAARREAEHLLETKSRELYEANQRLEKLAADLEHEVRARTAKLKLALRKAEEASEVRSRFLAAMSHEIRTPLGGIIGMLDLIRREEDISGSGIERLNAAISSADSMHRIVNDVLDLSKLDAGKMHFEREDVDFRAVASSIVALFGAKASARQLRFEVDIDTTVPDHFVGDANRLRQVLSNLCDNAVKFSDNGTITIRAGACERSGKKILRVEVSDDGAGISKKGRRQLFLDYSQLKESYSQRAGGSGLGLAICKRIVTSIGGRIGVHSEVGIGSTFWFEIPLIVSEVVGLATESPNPSQFDIDNGEVLQGMRLLLAEDNFVNQKLVCAYVERMGGSVKVAPNGRIAVQEAVAGTFDAILMDVAMPEMDGLAATIAIREVLRGKGCPPIIGLTAHVMQSVVDECREAGMDDVLFKPISPERLATTLMRHLMQRRHIASTKDERNGAKSEVSDSKINATKFASKDLTQVIAPDVLVDLRASLDEGQLHDLLLEFCSDAEARLEVMLNSLVNDDRARLQHEVHSISGASAMFGLRAIREIATSIEEKAFIQSASELGQEIASVTRLVDQLRVILMDEKGCP